MKFKESVNTKELRNHSLILLGLILAVFITSTYLTGSESRDDLIQKEVEVAIPLWCFDSNIDFLWKSEVKYGCGSEDLSLGEGKISAPLTEVSGLNINVKNRFLAAQSEAKKVGINLVITSGFRTAERQQYLFNRAIEKYGSEREASKWVLPPDKSHHPDGIALDINYPGDPEDTKWLELNGYKYGLCRVYENEWWHFEPVIAPGEECPALVANALTKVD